MIQWTISSDERRKLGRAAGGGGHTAPQQLSSLNRPQIRA
jgi:hypothetical protein